VSVDKYLVEMTVRRMRRQVARLEGRGTRAMAVPGGTVLLRMLAGRLEGWAGDAAVAGPDAPVWRAGLDEKGATT